MNRKRWQRRPATIARQTMCRDLERLKHDPEIWLTGMKPGQEERILRQVIDAAARQEYSDADPRYRHRRLAVPFRSQPG